MRELRWCALFFCLFASALFASAEEDFREAVKRYDEGKFSESAGAFRSIIDRGYSSAQLFYNAGCAYYKAGKLGLAIANFRRAERLSPDDEDIRANLAFARQFSVDKIDDAAEVNFLDEITDFLATLHPNQYFIISLISLALIFTFLALKRMGRLSRFGHSPVILLSIITIFSAVAMIWVLKSNYLLDEGVIIVEQTEIMSGPGSDFELQFEGHEGLMFKILDSRGDYHLGLFANKLKGWVKQSAVERI